jgi:carboxyl-terminal processing protease
MLNMVNSLRRLRYISIIFWLTIIVSCGRLVTNQKSVTSPPTSTTLTPSMQLKLFEYAWKAVNDDYLDPDFNGIDWDAIHKEYRKKIVSGLSTRAFYGVMVDLIDELGDNHSHYSPPMGIAPVDSQLVDDPSYENIGVIIMTVPGQQYTVVVTTSQGGPAEEAGLKSLDRILAIDGNPPVDENGEIRGSLFRGPPGTSVTLTVQTPGQELRDIQVMRRSINNPILTVPYQVLTTSRMERVGYILISYFDIRSDSQVRNALETLSADAPLDGLILDFRVNDGGNLDAWSRTLSFFTAGSIGYRISRDEKKLMVVGPLNDINGSSKIPLVTLIGKDTASGAEIFVGVLQDTRRAYLIGETTAGKVGILNAYEGVDGSFLYILHEAFRPINHPDTEWNRVGIDPDQIVSAPFGTTIEDDLAIQEALKYLDQK